MKAKVKAIKEDKYESKLHDIEEHYEDRVNEILPENLHRGDIVSTTRLLGYLDAFMATCATFLVIPLRNLREMNPNESLKDFIEGIRLEMVMFFLGYLAVLNIWQQNIIRSYFIKRLDDFLVLMVILAMIAVSALPFSLALWGHFPKESTSVIMTCALLGFNELIDLVMIMYVSFTPCVLHIEMRTWSKKDIRMFCLTAAIKNGTNLLLILVIGLIYMTHFAASWVSMALLVLTPWFRKAILFARRRLTAPGEMDQCRFRRNFMKENISKERVEVMSDAAIAIIACILILDITVEEFPKEADVHAHGLVSVLEHMTAEFVIFYAAFVSVSALWYVNHTVLHLFHTMNVVTLYLQKFFLAFTCFIPLASNMVNKYGRDNDKNGKVSVLFGMMVMLLASACNLLILIFGLSTKEKYLHSWANRSCFKENLRKHLYVILKVVNIPLWQTMGLFLVLGRPSTSKHVILVLRIGVPVTFLVLKVIFMNNLGKKTYYPKDVVLANINVKENKENTVQGGVNLSGPQENVNDSEKKANENEKETTDIQGGSNISQEKTCGIEVKENDTFVKDKHVFDNYEENEMNENTVM